MRNKIFFVFILTILFLPVNLFATTYGSNVLIGGTASAGSTYDTYYSANAFDGNTATRWIGNLTTLPEWIQYDLGAGITKTIAKISVWMQADENKDFRLFGSNTSDFSASTTLGSFTSAGVSSYQDFTFSNTTAFRYYRILVLNSYVLAYADLWEWQGFEVSGGGAPTGELPNLNIINKSSNNILLSYGLSIIMAIISLGVIKFI